MKSLKAITVVTTIAVVALMSILIITNLNNVQATNIRAERGTVACATTDNSAALVTRDENIWKVNKWNGTKLTNNKEVTVVFRTNGTNTEVDDSIIAIF